jgi:hypothetical protein
LNLRLTGKDTYDYDLKEQCSETVVTNRTVAVNVRSHLQRSSGKRLLVQDAILWQRDEYGTCARKDVQALVLKYVDLFCADYRKANLKP